MPKWRFRWSQCVVFTGHILKLSVKRDAALRSDVTACTRVQPELAWARRRAVAQQSASETHGSCCCILELGSPELTCRLLWAFFQFKPRSWTSSVLLRNYSARTWTDAAFERWIGENWVEPLPFERATWSDPKIGITFGAGQNKTPVYNGGTSSNLMSPPSTEALVESCWPDGSDGGAWASVTTRRSCSCACLSIPPSVCVCVCVCCSLSAVFLLLLDSVEVETVWIWLCILCHR